MAHRKSESEEVVNLFFRGQTVKVRILSVDRARERMIASFRVRG